MRFATVDTWLIEAGLLSPDEALEITDGAGRLTYLDTAKALRAQYPKSYFLTGEHGVPWVRKLQ